MGILKKGLQLMRSQYLDKVSKPHPFKSFLKKKIIKDLISDGVLVSTPAGSTAYNLSVHGPILNLNSNKLSISPISP